MKTQRLKSFPWFFVEQSLRTARWPRKDGLFRPSYVPQFILAMSLDQVSEIAVALGAGHPETALGVLAALFEGRDWQHQPASEIFSAYDASRAVRIAGDQVPPWTAIADALGWRASADVLTNEVSSSMKMGTPLTFQWSVLQVREFQVSLVALFVTALLWGFNHPEEAFRALKEDCARLSRRLENAIHSGLDLPPNYRCPPAEQIVELAALVIDAYEDKHRFRFRACKELLETPQAKRRLTGPGLSSPRTREAFLLGTVPQLWLPLNAHGRLCGYRVLAEWMEYLRSAAADKKLPASHAQLMRELVEYLRGYLVSVRGMELPDARLLVMDPQLGPVMDQTANTWALGVTTAKIDLCDMLQRRAYTSPLMQPINQVLDDYAGRYAERKPAIIQYLRQMGHPVADE